MRSILQEGFPYLAKRLLSSPNPHPHPHPHPSPSQECFPYLAKRLLSDDSPRARGALRTLLYGQGDELNLDQLKKVTQGLESNPQPNPRPNPHPNPHPHPNPGP